MLAMTICCRGCPCGVRILLWHGIEIAIDDLIVFQTHRCVYLLRTTTHTADKSASFRARLPLRSLTRDWFINELLYTPT